MTELVADRKGTRTWLLGVIWIVTTTALLTGCAPSLQTGAPLAASRTATADSPTTSSATPVASSATSEPAYTPSVSESAPETQTVTAECRPGQLTVSLSQAKPPGTDVLFGLLAFTNTGSAACALHGWPKVTLTTPENSLLTTASPARAITDKPVTLAPGAAAYAYLRYTLSRDSDGKNIGCAETLSRKYTFNVTSPPRGADPTPVPNPSLYLCTDQKQDLIVWAIMPKIEPLNIG